MKAGKEGPMQKNYGPMLMKSPMKDNILDKIKNRVSNSYAGSIYKGVKNVVSKRSKGFDVINNKGQISHGYTGTGVIPTNKDQANKIVERFKKGYKRRTN